MARIFLQRRLKRQADLLRPFRHPALQGDLLGMRSSQGGRFEWEWQVLERYERHVRENAVGLLGHQL